MTWLKQTYRWSRWERLRLVLAPLLVGLAIGAVITAIIRIAIPIPS